MPIVAQPALNPVELQAAPSQFGSPQLKAQRRFPKSNLEKAAFAPGHSRSQWEERSPLKGKLYDTLENKDLFSGY